MNDTKTTFIYTLSDKYGNIRYVGKTNNLSKRLYAHIIECKKDRVSHKSNWIKSLLKQNEKPIIEILDVVPLYEWELHEIYWIEQLKAWGFNLTNISPGGYNNNYRRSISAKMKMRQSKLGTKLSGRHKQNISNSIKLKSLECPNYNKCYDKEVIIDKDVLYEKYITENLSTTKIAKLFNTSCSTIFRNLREYKIKKDKKIWKEQCSHSKKIVLQYDLNGKLIKEWYGISVIKDELKINAGNIANCCRGVSITAGGFIWRYKDNFIEIDLKKLDYQKRKISQYDIGGNFIKNFNSIKEGAIELNIDESCIQSCCANKLKSYKGYIWKYYDDKSPIEYDNKSLKRVLQYDKNMNLIAEYSSIREAEKKTGCRSNCIITCCRGKYKSSGGFIWRYHHDIKFTYEQIYDHING